MEKSIGLLIQKISNQLKRKIEKVMQPMMKSYKQRNLPMLIISSEDYQMGMIPC